MIVYRSGRETQAFIRVWRSLVSRLNGVQEASSSNLDTRTKKAETVFTVSAFFISEGEIRTSVATLRGSVAREGLTERNNNFCRRQKCKRISTLGEMWYGHCICRRQKCKRISTLGLNYVGWLYSENSPKIYYFF